ncbi:MAG: PilZ domain-containing protein [Polyangiales bacterium]
MEHLHDTRGERTPRFPLDEVLIELSHSEYDDVFEADAVNVGPGGLALRSALLPEIGSRLRCRFASPLDGDLIDADCEVMWAESSGPHMGEFGLRFAEMDGASAESLRRLVESCDGYLPPELSSGLGWNQPHASDAEPSGEEACEDEAVQAASDEPATVALRLDGVASELVAEVAHTSDDALLVEQELPFLRIGTGVASEDGRRGVLQAVDLRLEGDTPRLVLTVAFPEAERVPAEAPALLTEALEEPVEAASDLDTLPDAVPAFAGAAADPADEPALVERAVPRKPAAPARAAAATISDALEAEVENARPSIVEEARPAKRPAAGRERDTPRAFSVENAPRGPRAIESDALVEETSDRPSLAGAAAVLATAKTAFLGSAEKGGPLLEKLVAAIRHAFARFVEVAIPRLREGVSASAAFGKRFGSALAEKLKQDADVEAELPPRRVQRRPGQAEAPRTSRAGVSAPVEKPRTGKKNALVIGFALAVVGLGVYGMVRGSSEAPAPAVPAPAAVTPAPEASVEAEPAQPVAVAAAQAPAAAAMPTAPRALPEPQYAAGQMPAPTYPTMRTSDATTATTVSPAAAPAPQAGPSMSFGAADVPNGTPFELTMSTPIEGVYGQVTPTGFTVRIPNTYSLSRAGPIAASHPYVDRAAITNLGDAAELRIDWKPGRNPAYRVEARGSKLVVILGR